MPLSAFKDMHAGDTALIVGNGPSLKGVPLDFLRKYISFGTNLIYLHRRFVPNYYVAVDPSVVRRDYISRVTRLPSTKFLSDNRYKKEKLYRLIPGAIKLPTTTEKGFLCDDKFWEGWSVTYVALQLAYWMGFTTALLVGMDHRYNCGEPNHFHPDYEKDYVWVVHDMTKAITAYEMAKEAYEADGRKIVNLTPKSALRVFPFQKVQDWM